MGGGLMQLVAYGAQDVYLSGNPQITFFKVVYRRHTNFSVEPIQQTWNGAPDFGRTVTCNINRNGDLITNMYVAVTLNSIPASNNVAWGYVNRLGHAMIDDVKVEIGGSKIDEQYGDWLNIWYELTHKSGQTRGYAKMIGDIQSLTEVSTAAKKGYQLYVPLQFWFNRNNGLALPLIALQYHDVRITLVFRKALDCINWAGSAVNPPSVLPTMQDSYLLIDYVYLDSEERKRFAQASHEYLIEQLQFTGSESLTPNPKYRLNFNHPSKYLIWVPHLERYLTRNEWIAYAFDGDWAAAKDRFAKVLFIASRDKLSATAPTQTGGSGAYNVVGSALNSSSTEVWVDRGGLAGQNASAAGDLFEPLAQQSPTLSTAILNLLAKIDVKCVCQKDPNADTDVTVLIADATTPAGVLSQLFANTIVTKNELTMEDISKTVAEFSLLNQTVVDMAKLSVINYHNYANFIDGSDNPVYNAKLQLNGHDRFQARDGNYFNYVQPFQHFSNTPSDGINVYSFALKAEDHQPTGTCNFSRIDNATLQVDVGMYNAPPPKDSSYSSNYIASGSLLNIYTMNYNVLRVMSGMAGTAYSN
jgi:hypothetical protein